jgi:hypothetical protein
MTLHRPLEFFLVTIGRSEKIGAYQKQDDSSLFKLVVDCCLELLTGADFTIVPSFDRSLSLQRRKVNLKLIS